MSEKPEPVECPQCHAIIAQDSNFKRHLKGVHGLDDLDWPLVDTSYLPPGLEPVPNPREIEAKRRLDGEIASILPTLEADPVSTIVASMAVPRGAPDNRKGAVEYALGKDREGTIKAHAERIAYERLGGLVDGCREFANRKAAFQSADFSHREAHVRRMTLGANAASQWTSPSYTGTAHRQMHLALGMVYPEGIAHEHLPGGVVVNTYPPKPPTPTPSHAGDELRELRERIAALEART